MQTAGLTGAWEVNGSRGAGGHSDGPDVRPSGSGSGSGRHWSDQIRETVLTGDPERLPFSVEGGSQVGQFAFLGDVQHEECGYISGRLEADEVLVEVQGQQVGGYTRRDVCHWLQHCLRNGNACVLKTARNTSHVSLTRDLRVYLNTRFQKGSVDHELQNAIRDNLYLRTVPVTTREPRPNEVSGVDYTFLSIAEFKQLERSGNLLESGVYDGNHYGTPKPSVDSTVVGQRSAGAPVLGDVLLPGRHPRSEGKRRRNRSNVEAMAAKTADPEPHEHPHQHHPQQQPAPEYPAVPPEGGGMVNGLAGSEELGPLPDHWEQAYTEYGEPYFIDHSTGTSHWLDPRLALVQKRSLEECDPDELPYGWERVDDAAYGTYYIDHVNRRTQYENPVHEAKRLQQQEQQPQHSGGASVYPDHAHQHQHSTPAPELAAGDGELREPLLHGQETGRGGVPAEPEPPPPPSAQHLGHDISPRHHLHQPHAHDGPPHPLHEAHLPPQHPPPEPAHLPPQHLQHQELSHLPPHHHPQQPQHPAQPQPHVHNGRAFFTRNPDELQGRRVQTTLHKSPRGLGFTIVGGDDGDEEFLQIKSVVPNGPAWLDAKLNTGDVLVYVNGQCVLGYTHQDMVRMFQTIEVGERVHLTVCRGYPLPFDPDDPNTEIVTTMAVSAADSQPGGYPATSAGSDRARSPPRHRPDESIDSGRSLPDLGPGHGHSGDPSGRPEPDLRPASADLPPHDIVPPTAPKPRFLTVPIVKGDGGFGFTIADSAYGQKVKKILDRARCTELQEGDILVEINAIQVKSMPHAEVVQVLKDCPAESAATVRVQRGGSHSPSKPRAKKKDDNTRRPPIAGQYRSKTPTADLYSTQTREVVPSRPKTPLVDTRRVHTPSFGDDMSRLTFHGDVRGDERSALTFHGRGRGDERAGSPLGGGPGRPAPTGAPLAEQFGRLGLHSSYDERDLNYHRAAGDAGAGRGYGGAPFAPDGYYGHHAGAHPRPADLSFDYSAAGDYPPHSAGYQPYPSMPPTSEQPSRRKQSTSFEHELPSPSSVPRGYRPHQYLELAVTLQRQESGFGFRIIGGTEERSQVSIGHIVPGGAADLDGRLQTGDEIIYIDGQLVIGSSHQHAVQLMSQASGGGRVQLGVRRRLARHDALNRSHDAAPYDVAVTRREGEGFGFVIISSASRSGSTIGRLIEGSPAHRCGQLHVGDRILAVNGVDIGGLHHGQIVNLIKDSGYRAVLTVGPPLDDSSSTTSASLKGEPLPADVAMGGPHEDEFHAIELSRGYRGFGFSIRGGREFQSMPLFVLRIAEQGPAAQDGRLRVGDQIIEINQVNTKNMTHGDAIELIRQGGAVVRLLIRRGVRVPQAVLDQAAALTPTGRPPSALSQPHHQGQGPYWPPPQPWPPLPNGDAGQPPPQQRGEPPGHAYWSRQANL